MSNLVTHSRKLCGLNAAEHFNDKTDSSTNHIVWFIMNTSLLSSWLKKKLSNLFYLLKYCFKAGQIINLNSNVTEAASSNSFLMTCDIYIDR